MILFYRIITNIIYPVLIIFIFFRKLINKEDKKRYIEKIFASKFNVLRNKNSKLVWFHAASVGEIKSIIPIIKNLIENNKNLEILLTTVTLSAGNLVQAEIKNYENIYHRYFPLDVGFLIKKFLVEWNPQVIFLVDSEIWPNLIFESNEKEIPLALINARITKKTFNRWMLIPNTAKSIFEKFKLCLASNNETQNYLEKLNVKNINFYGNIKLINTTDKSLSNEQHDPILKKSKVWCAISTHKGEEEFCLEVHKILNEEFKNIITIIAPRHIQRVDEIKSLCNNFSLTNQILNKDEKILENKEIIIINSFGVLSKYIEYSKSVFIGKSLLKKLERVGGQSPIEAASLGCKVYHGPFIYNFKEIYETLEKNNISNKIQKNYELAKYIIEDFKSQDKDVERTKLFMQNLSKKTFFNTMKKINEFIK